MRAVGVRAAALLSAVAVSIGLIAVSTGTDASAAGIAYDPDRFEAGDIISDALFFDGGSMSASEIQDFLDDKGSGCTTGSSGQACLKDYKVTVAARAATSTCDAIPAFKNGSVASYIETVGEACGISQRVLLVTLQKEQGLVTATSPSSRQYEIAMGYGCPDTAACDSDYYGFANQVWRAANQFQRYATYPENYRFRAGGTSNIAYSPSSSCGSKSVTIENAATAALYNYTPYTPNDAALDAWPGTASCGAYGNRNFFAFYSMWFGSTQLDTSLFKVSGLSSIWVIEGNTRWRILGTDTELQKDARVWGKVATVSSQYLSTFDNGGDFTGIMLSPQDTYFVVDGDYRHTVRTCDDLEDYGFDCDAAVPLGWDLVRAFTVAGDLPDVVTDVDGKLYWLNAGQKHRILDEASAEDAGLTVTDTTFTRSTVLSGHALGESVVATGSVYKVSGTSDFEFLSVDGRVTIPASSRTDVDLVSWLGGSNGSLTEAQAETLPEDGELGYAFSRAGGDQYILTADGIASVDASSAWAVAGANTLPDDLLDALPTASAMPDDAGVATVGSGESYWIEDGAAGRIPNAEGAQLFQDAYGVEQRSVLSGYVDLLADGGTALAPGSIVRSGSSGPKYLIDGSGVKHPISWKVLRETSLVPLHDLADGSVLDSFTTADEAVGLGLMCDGEAWLQFDGVIHPLTAAGLDAYEEALTFTELDAATCAALTDHEKVIDPLLKVWGEYWIVEDGSARIISIDEYREYRETYSPAKAASTALMTALGVSKP